MELDTSEVLHLSIVLDPFVNFEACFICKVAENCLQLVPPCLSLCDIELDLWLVHDGLLNAGYPFSIVVL